MYLLIVFLPLISALVAGMFGRFVGREGAKYITTSAIFITFLMSCTAFYEVALLGRPAYLDLAPWIQSGMFSFSWGFLFDSLTVGNVGCCYLCFFTSSPLLDRVYGS